jgi:uncharacterized phiE125 gp8 family phage protein
MIYKHWNQDAQYGVIRHYLQMVTPPVLSPVSVSEAVKQLRLDATYTPYGSMTPLTLTPNPLIPITGGASGYSSPFTIDQYQVSVVAYITSIGTGASFTGRLEVSDDNAVWTTVYTFATATDVNSVRMLSYMYTGNSTAMRFAYTLSGGNVTISVNYQLISLMSTGSEDIQAFIDAATAYVEGVTSRALLTQTQDMLLQNWPNQDFITIPLGNLQQIESIVYTNISQVPVTLIEGTDYVVKCNGPYMGRVILPYGRFWPTEVLYAVDPITIQFTSGWTTAALVPADLKAAILRIIAKLYMSRGDDISTFSQVIEDKFATTLLSRYRLSPER